MRKHIKKAVAFVKNSYIRFHDNRLLKSLLLDVSKNDELYIKSVLQNELNALNNTWSSDGQGTKRDQKVFLMKIAKEVMTRILVLRHIVGIQPMQGPVGLIYTLEYLQQDGEPMGTKEGAKLMLEVKSRAVAAGSRKLQAGYTLEGMQDLRAQHGPEMEGEMICALGAEIAEEIIAEIVADVTRIADEKGKTFDVKVKAGAKSITEMAQNTMVTINMAANEIARLTRRGCGNFLITDPLNIALIQSMAEVSGYDYVEKDDTSYGSLAYVGVLKYKERNGKPGGDAIKVLSSLYAKPNTIIIGYKGGNGETDTAFIYNPYVPVMPIGVVVNEKFQPVMHFMTRYGKIAREDVGNYFATVKTVNLLDVLP